MIDEYLANGYQIFRNIIPPSLLADLRCQADIARDLAHQLNGRQTQRIQPLDQYGDRIDLQPFRDYVELPALKDAVEALLGPGYTHGHLHVMGLLVEPLDHPWHCGWHRDGVVEVPIARPRPGSTRRRRRGLARLAHLQPGQLRTLRRFLHLVRTRQPPALL